MKTPEEILQMIYGKEDITDTDIENLLEAIDHAEMIEDSLDDMA